MSSCIEYITKLKTFKENEYKYFKLLLDLASEMWNISTLFLLKQRQRQTFFSNKFIFYYVVGQHLQTLLCKYSYCCVRWQRALKTWQNISITIIRDNLMKASNSRFFFLLLLISLINYAINLELAQMKSL